MGKPRVGILVRRSLREMILPAEALEELERFAEVNLNLEDRDFTEEEAAEFLRDADGAVSSWGTPSLTSAILEAAPGLKVWAHAAGSAKPSRE